MIEARIILDDDNAWVAGQQTSTASVVVIWELVLNTTHIFMFKQIKFLHVKQSLHLHLHFADEQKSFFKKMLFPKSGELSVCVTLKETILTQRASASQTAEVGWGKTYCSLVHDGFC